MTRGRVTISRSSQTELACSGLNSLQSTLICFVIDVRSIRTIISRSGSAAYLLSLSSTQARQLASPSPPPPPPLLLLFATMSYDFYPATTKI